MYRILFANRYSSWGGGAEARLLEIATALAAEGYIPFLVTSSEGELTARFRRAGVESYVFPPSYFLRKQGYVRYYLAAPRAIRALLRELRIDLVHTNDSRSIEPFIRAAGPLGIPVVSHVTDMDGGWFSRRNLKFLNRAAAIVAVNEAVSAYAKRHGVDPVRLRVIYRGIDSRRFEAVADTRAAIRDELGMSNGEVCVGMFARLHPRKGQEDLVRAAADSALSSRQMRYLFAGEDWEPDRSYEHFLRNLSTELGISDRVSFLGYREDAPSLMGACDLTAAPFRREAFGGAVAESMFAGTPVVGYREGGIPEIVRDGRDGLLVDPGDIAGLAAALLHLAADAPLRGAMAASALNRAKDFSFERQLTRIRSLYNEILEQGGIRGGS